ncbi:helicase HerA-like domain-containing protein [Pseudoclavibacter sp. JSM 162008]|uniref:helicase HerA-like domain-containing protein n=1 Tax=Pseudoclavibacter sp. JSM 162008 TaxID=3229855 RepID=UPI00352622B8
MTDADARIEAARRALEEATAALAAAEAEAEASAAAESEPVPEPVPESEPEPEPAPAPATAASVSGPLDEQQLEAVRAGYAFEAAALEIGAIVNGEAVPGVPVRIPLAMTNRHGLVAGATGTGKTKTLQVLAEQLSAAGVPVFAADIKGDLSGIATPGEPNDKLLARTRGIGQDWVPAAAPTEVFSLGGRGIGVPIRATVSSFGPLMLSKVLGLNKTQESSLGLVFHFADEHGLALVDLSDLRTVLQYLTSAEGKVELEGIGGLSKQTAGVILRELVNFSEQGADIFFGETEIDTREFLRVTDDGRGVVSLLELPGVASNPALFSTFLMWLLADLFNELPEVGDLDKPKLVFFFDEAHLLFSGASKAFIEQITQTVRLIRSKGVGIFFVTQTPKDVPDDVLAQLGSRIQHQLRAHTPDDATALRQTVRTYPKSGYDLEEVLTQLATGEAIVTVMNEKGAPSPVAWTRLRAPQASMSPTPEEGLRQLVASSSLYPRYSPVLDPQSAHEVLTAKMNAAAERERAEGAAAEAEKQAAKDAKERERAERATRSRTQTRTTTRARQDTGGGNVVSDLLGSRTGQTIVREVVRGVFGTLFKKRR